MRLPWYLKKEGIKAVKTKHGKKIGRNQSRPIDPGASLTTFGRKILRYKLYDPNIPSGLTVKIRDADKLMELEDEDEN